MISSSFTHIVAYITIYLFCKLNNHLHTHCVYIPLCYFILISHSAYVTVDGRLGCFHFVISANNVAGNMSMQIVILVLLFILCRCSHIELLIHTILKNSLPYHFPQLLQPFLFSPEVHKNSSFSTILTILVIFFSVKSLLLTCGHLIEKSRFVSKSAC